MLVRRVGLQIVFTDLECGTKCINKQLFIAINYTSAVVDDQNLAC